MLSKLLITIAVALFVSLVSCGAIAQTVGKYNAIYSGIPWFDNRGKIVSAHGANIIKNKNRFYLFGEAHTDTSNAFAGFNCYSSADLYNWKYETVALPVQAGGKLGPNRVGERPKVMKCPGTGEYVMYMHVDTLGYVDQFIGYATATTIAGPYTFKGPLLFNGKPIRKWDMGTFQDSDGSGYVLIHGGEIYKLGDDYKTVSELVNENMVSGFESPAMFRKDSIYYLLGSDLTSWERNDNYYYTATSLKGPWTLRGFFAPKGTLTWNSQTSFVLPVEGSKDTGFLFMGDRWAFPKQASAATYVWQPLIVSGTSLSIPQFQEAWKINTATGIVSPAGIGKKTNRHADDKLLITKTGKWEQVLPGTNSVSSSDEKDASFSILFKGTQIGFYGLAKPDGGYARVTLKNSKGIQMFSSLVDLYSKYPDMSLRFFSPKLPKGNYTLSISITGEHGTWSDKRKNNYGSTGNIVSVGEIVVVE